MLFWIGIGTIIMIVGAIIKFAPPCPCGCNDKNEDTLLRH